MIALDTNILVRFLVEDDEAQTERVRAFLKQTIGIGEKCFVSDVVLCEIVWVLERRYKFSHLEISQALERLLNAQHLAFASADLLYRALTAYSSGQGDFADYVIREHALAHACGGVATFDGICCQSTVSSPCSQVCSDLIRQPPEPPPLRQCSRTGRSEESSPRSSS